MLIFIGYVVAVISAIHLSRKLATCALLALNRRSQYKSISARGKIISTGDTFPGESSPPPDCGGSAKPLPDFRSCLYTHPNRAAIAKAVYCPKCGRVLRAVPEWVMMDPLCNGAVTRETLPDGSIITTWKT